MELLKILPVPLLLAVTMASNLAASVTKKQYGNLGCGGKDNAYIYSAVTSAVCAVLMVLFSGFRIQMSWYTAGLGLLFGICTMLTTVLLTMAMTIGPMSYSMVINSASTVITALSGFLFWDEKLGALKIVGLVLMAGCFVFSVKKDSNGKRASLAWFLLSLFSAVACAGVGLLQKIHQSSAHSDELMGFLIIAFLFSFVVSAVPYLWHRRGALLPPGKAKRAAVAVGLPAGENALPAENTQNGGARNADGAAARAAQTAGGKAAQTAALQSAAQTCVQEEPDGAQGAQAAAENAAPAQTGASDPAQAAAENAAPAQTGAKRRFRWGKGAVIAMLIVSGVAIALNNIINLYLAGVMDSAVFFPLVNGGGLVLGIVAGLAVFREKLTVMQWIGIACGVAATLMLCL